MELGQKSAKCFLLTSYGKQLGFELHHSLAIDLLSQKFCSLFPISHLIIGRKA